MRNGWAAPQRWARVGAWLLVPNLVLDWFTAIPQQVFVVVFVVAVIGLCGIAAAATVGMLGRSRVGTVVLGAVLLFGGLAFLGLDPIPGGISGIGSWWPAAITQPQLVGSAYWTVAGLGIVLSGVGMLATSLILAVTRAPARR